MLTGKVEVKVGGQLLAIVSVRVGLEGVGMPEALITQRTLIGELIGVDAPVSLQITWISELRPTLGTIKRFFPRVKQPMRLHTLQVVELGAADVAQVAALLHTALLVAPQTVRLREALPAPITSIPLHVAVDRYVLL